MPDVRVYTQSWRGKETLLRRNSGALKSAIPDKTQNGVYEWTWAPDDPVTYQFIPQNTDRQFAKGEDVSLTADDQEHVVVLKSALRVTGRVTDAKTGQPVPHFTIIPVNDWDADQHADLFHVNRDDAREFSDGQYTLDVVNARVAQRLRIEAEGYRTAMSDAFHVGQPDRTCDFPLQPAPPSAGRIVGADGQPVAGAKVFLATKSQGLEYFNQKLPDDTGYGNEFVDSDASGAFAFPAQFERYTVIVTHDDGYAEVTLQPEQLPGELKLKKWARVAGRVLEAGRPVAGAEVVLDAIRPRIGQYSYINDRLARKTDEAGRFVFERVPPRKLVLKPELGPLETFPITSAESVPLDLKPGEEITRDLGGAGAQLTGYVSAGGDAAHEIDLHYSLNWLVQIAPGIEPPAELAALGFDWRQGFNGLQKGPPGGAFRETLHHYLVTLASDGSFVISGVPAGQYDLAFKIFERPEGCLVDPVGIKVVRIQVAESDVAKGSLDLGKIDVDVSLGPKPGDLVPDFAFELLDGGRKKLSEFRGQYLLVDFWATWCDPCVASLPAVRRLHDEYRAGGRLTVLGLSLNADQGTAREFVRQRGLPWMQGFLGDSSDGKTSTRLGVSSAPTYLLIDPAGKLVARYHSVDKAKEKIASVLEPGSLVSAAAAQVATENSTAAETKPAPAGNEPAACRPKRRPTPSRRRFGSLTSAESRSPVQPSPLGRSDPLKVLMGFGGQKASAKASRRR